MLLAKGTEVRQNLYQYITQYVNPVPVYSLSKYINDGHLDTEAQYVVYIYSIYILYICTLYNEMIRYSAGK